MRSDTIRLNSAEAMMVVSVTPLPGKGAVCSDGLVQTYEALVASGVLLDAHAAAVETLLQRTDELSPSDVRRGVALEMLLGGGVGDGGQPRQGICSVQSCEVSDTLLASTSTVAVQVPTRVGHAGWTPYSLPERRQALAAGGDIFLSRVRGDGGVRLQVSSEGVCVSDAYDFDEGWTLRWSEVAAVLYDASDTMIMVATIGRRVEVRAQRWTPGVLDSVRRHAPSDLLRSVPVTAAPAAAPDGVPLQGDLKRRRLALRSVGALLLAAAILLVMGGINRVRVAPDATGGSVAFAFTLALAAAVAGGGCWVLRSARRITKRGGRQEGEFRERGRVEFKLDGAITRVEPGG